jgi:hypothetical protein
MKNRLFSGFTKKHFADSVVSAQNADVQIERPVDNVENNERERETETRNKVNHLSRVARRYFGFSSGGGGTLVLSGRNDRRILSVHSCVGAVQNRIGQSGLLVDDCKASGWIEWRSRLTV